MKHTYNNLHVTYYNLNYIYYNDWEEGENNHRSRIGHTSYPLIPD